MPVPAAPTLSVVEEPAVRAAVLTVGVPAGALTITVWRVGPSGTRAGVRTWDPGTVTSSPSTLTVRDYETPIGVPVSYYATAGNTEGQSTPAGPVAFTLPAGECDMWLTDLARAGNTQQVLVEALPELAYPTGATVHDILSRRTPIVTSDIAHTPAFELAFLTATPDARDAARYTLGNGIPVLLRTPPEDGIGNLYFSVLEFSEQRIVSRGTVQDRRFSVQGRQVDRPDTSLYAPAPPQLYSSVLANFATYQAVLDENASYDALAYSWVGSSPSDIYPWPPVDV